MGREWVKLSVFYMSIFGNSSFRLAAELFQNVQRLFGDPHQSTEDLKVEVIFNLSSYL